MTVRIGINPIGWSNDDLRELGGDTPLQTCLAEARQAGFAGIELGHKFPRQAAALRRCSTRTGWRWSPAGIPPRCWQRDAAAESRRCSRIWRC